MKYIFLLTALTLVGCAHLGGKQYNLLRVTCPDGTPVEVKVPYTEDAHLYQTTANNRVRAACGLSDVDVKK